MTIATTLPIPASDKFFAVTTPSASPSFLTEAETEKPSNVVFRDFQRAEEIGSPEGFRKVSAMLAEHESNSARANAIARARQQLGVRWSNQLGFIASKRMAKGLSQRQLADALGTSQPHIARIESGREDIRRSTILRLAAALDIPPAELLERL